MKEIQEKVKQFNQLIGNYTARRTEFKQAVEAIKADILDLDERFKDLILQGKDDESKGIEQQIAQKRGALAKAESRLAALGNFTRDALMTKAQSEPESQLHALALAIQDEGLQRLGAVKQEFSEIIDGELAEAKAAYLKVIERLGALKSESLNLCVLMKRTRPALAKDERRDYGPVKVDPARFEVTDAAISQSYGSIGFWSGPDHD